jgi:hypothetical protein
MKTYKKWWKETPGAMTLLHYAVATGAATLGLLRARPLWGLVALLVWLVSMVGMMQICAAWDLGK